MNAGQQGAFSANSPGLQSRPNAYALGPHPQDIRRETPCRPAGENSRLAVPVSWPHPSKRSSEKLPARRPGKLGPHPQDIRGETPCRPAKGKLSAHRPSKLGSFENT